jgi:predicted nucleic acid-binding protein
MKVTCDSDVLSNFGRGKGRGAREVREAIERGVLVLNPITLFETRGGMERPEKVADFDRRFGHLEVLDLGRAAALRAGDLWRDLRRTGRVVHMRDLLMASVADASRARLLTADNDFQQLVDLGLDIQIVTVATVL